MFRLVFEMAVPQVSSSSEPAGKLIHTLSNDSCYSANVEHDETSEMGSTPEFRKAFVARLKQACDESTLIPKPGQGRQQMIADRLGVGAEATSKWFKGVSMPRPDKMAMLADLLEVDQSWLVFGIEPELDRSERRMQAKASDGAIHYVWGLIMLAGGHCGEPSSRDPRGAYVDCYATLRGSVYPLCIRLASDSGRDQYIVNVPVEYKSARVIVVVPVGPGRYDCIDLPMEVIDEYKERSKGEYRLTFTNGQGGRYFFGSQQIMRIKNFAELK